MEEGLFPLRYCGIRRRKGIDMEFERLGIPDLIVFKPKVFHDNRGFFMETFIEQEFREICGDYSLVQTNVSASKQGTLRGLHYQVVFPQGKLVSAVVGKVFDVAVDIRRDSPTFGQWCSAILSDENKNTFWVPPGFAHGFYALSEWSKIEYQCASYYSKINERGILWNDITVGIEWPIASDIPLLISEKDKNATTFLEAEYL